MDEDLAPTAGGINGINLDNYFPNRRSYNSVVYFHKKILATAKEGKVRKTSKEVVEKSSKKQSKGKKKSSIKHDKAQQFKNDEFIDEKRNQFQNFEPGKVHPIFGNTLNFAKNLVPLLIPTVKESTSAPLYYIIKTSKKHKKPSKNLHESSIEKDITYSKEKGHKLETTKKIKTKVHLGSCSARESIDLSSQNTLDDINMNINQSCSFSESTEVKYDKRERSNIKATNDSSRKYFVSRSFDALATESLSGEGNKIKIHLMNETDKNMFNDSIKNPIINAIRDCLSQLTNSYNFDFKTVQRSITCNNKKLDEVLEKLAYLEKKVNSIPTGPIITKPGKSPRVASASKASKLEELGKDLFETKEDKLSEEEFSEEYTVPRRRVRRSSKSVVVAIDENFGMVDKKKETMGCGEDVPGTGVLNASSSISQLGVKPDRPNRIPARFCWTDADRIK